ncbi:hypothetical protein [Streptococcus moroccensis]|uniref:Uncharacterized protein n=1 Tax=Streptococcus moroccensis TaxID=1451356 RepID=A0ABT9YNN0_9STRE|nr:hypothetical protein [Streptococcus moroccensis]MDQ0221593.1 hypothetical protein [Streptococcus moroccensis]
MSNHLTVGLVFLMFAGVLVFVVKPWFLGLPFFMSGLYFVTKALTDKKDKENENHDI